MEERLNRAMWDGRRRSGQGGFTLIELLVVIAVLSVLAAIVIFNVTGVKNKGTTASCQTDTQTLQTAVDAYYNATSAYPVTGGDTATPATGAVVNTSELLSGSYIHSVPGNGETFAYANQTTNGVGTIAGTVNATVCQTG